MKLAYLILKHLLMGNDGETYGFLSLNPYELNFVKSLS